MQLNNNLRAAKEIHKFWRAISVLFSLFVTVLISTIYASDTPIYIAKAKLAAPLTQLPVIKMRIMAEYSQRGHWPKKMTFNTNDGWPDPFESVEFDGRGTINLTLKNMDPNLSGKIVSFVANKSLDKDSTKIIWTCGYANPLNGFVAESDNKTNVDKKHLPRSCK